MIEAPNDCTEYMSTRHWLILSLAPGIGTSSLETLLEHFGAADAILAAKAGVLQGLGLSAAAAQALRNPDATKLAACEGWLEQPQHHFLHWQDPRYPRYLRFSL